MIIMIIIHKLDINPSNLLLLGLSQICSKVCPKCFQEFPKNFTYYASQCSYYACIMLLSCSNSLHFHGKFKVLTTPLEYFTTK